MEPVNTETPKKLASWGRIKSEGDFSPEAEERKTKMRQKYLREHRKTS